MDKKYAIKFLEQNQPMPNDDEICQELIDEYNSVREYFLLNPDKECIPLFLNSFGEINGYGVYQLVEDVILKYSDKEVLPHLVESLSSKHKGVKYWGSQIASNFSDMCLLFPLKKLLYEEDADLKIAAITALSSLKREIAINVFEDFSNQETDKYVLSFLKEVISDLYSE